MSGNEIDKVDREIIALLFNNGRETLTHLGEELEFVKGSKLSHVAVQKRLTKLRQKTIRISAQSNLKALQLQSAFILIETDHDTQRQIIEKTRLCPRVNSVDLLSGKMNLMMRLVAPSLQEIECFMSSVIKSEFEDGIRNYELFIGLENVKPKFLPVKIPFAAQRTSLHTPCGFNCQHCSMYKDTSCPGCPASKFSSQTVESFSE
ncbi:MAG: Lrp/AsnC family transcriptional regulator [Promethearchaeota archaeon]